ncbi:Ig-like domain-containing protein [Flavobacterium urocaniciphilum]|uniref:Por secretion system C-terminal sorting domain-containing protein n=1 Tax=Flavobacterium urocaniciphilum TaxID=1299341 RepID=A0A1H9CP71_9FLAO|nr:T9SS type A sorting domain-containing protein [Flavobacterium urocaniciphilum]SEQ03010.1 Por secretion system C-terminal sorting domain-containing protein [Flavobacterium urocaniciphilum]
MNEKLLSVKVFNCFESRLQSNWLFSTVLVLFLFCFSNELYSQTTLINPATDGGFNLGNTFAANGWTVANEGTGPIKWYLGTAASGTTSVGDTTSGSTTVTLLAPNANISIGQIVYGTNIPTNTFVQNIVGTTLTLSQNASGTASGVTLGFGRYAGGISVNASQLTTATISANTYSLTLAAANPNISVGMAIAPIAGIIDVNTYVASINGTALGLSKATINGSAVGTAQNLAFTATSAAINGNAAYITNNNGISYSYAGSPATRTVYFYKDVTVPSAEKAMTLTFDVKSDPNSGAGWQVWVAPVTQTVTGTNTQVTTSGTYGVNWPGATLISFNAGAQVATTKTTAFIPKSFAGTSFRLIFAWTNTAAAGSLPPAAIDNISLVSRIPEEITCAHSGLWSQPSTWDNGLVPTPADGAVIDNDGEIVMIDSRYSGCEDLILAGTNTLIQFATSTVIDEFTVNNDINLAASGSRFNNHDGTNGKYLKLGHNFDVGAGARFDSSFGSTTAYQGRLALIGSTVQTISVDPAGFVGGSIAGTNAFGNRAGVLNQLEVNNTATATPNVVWNVNGVRINGGLLLTNGRVNITSGNRLVLGNFGSILGSNFVCPTGNGFTNGTVSKWISASNTRDVQPGSEYPGTDNNYKPFWFPFVSANGLDRSMYLLPDATPATSGEVAVTYSDSNTVTGSLSITDGAYTINKRYNGNWAFSTPESSSNASSIIYAPNATTNTNRVGVYASGAYEALDGSSRLMNLSAALAGTHQVGTTQPFIFRKDLTIPNLTAAPVYVGVNDASSVNTSTAIVSAASGDWNSASTWVGSVVPTCTDVVKIANGHNVTVTTTANAAGVIINKGGTLTNNAGATTMTVGCTNNNAAFNNYGTHTMTAGILKVNGYVAHKTGSIFNQTGGDIVIDSNNNGDAATSVAFGGTSCKIETSDLDLTGGKITIVDPLVNIGTPISGTSISNYTLNTEGASGTFTYNGAITGTTATMATGTYNLFEVGQTISGHANILPGTTITAITVGFVGSPPPVTLTLSQAVSAPVPAATPLSFSSMKNGVQSVVLEANANNANLAVGQGVSGNGIQPGTTITNLLFAGLSTNFRCKVTLSSPVSGLATSPITAPETLTFSAVTVGANTTILTAANPNIVAGMPVSGAGILPGTFVADVNGTKVTFSEPIQSGAPTPLVLNFYPFNTLSSGSFIYSSANHYAAGLNHTLQIGDGVSTQNSSIITNGFNCQFQALGGLLSLGNLTVDAPNGADRFMNVGSNNINNAYNMNVQNALTITAGSSFRKTFANAIVYVGGNIINNGSFNLPVAGTSLYLGNFINGTAVPSTIPQTISGSGTYLANQYSLTSGYDAYVVNGLTINNTSVGGVTINVPNFRVNSVTLTNGVVHTSAAFPLYCGVPDVMNPSFNSGAFSGGNATSYFDGPIVYANKFDATITNYRLFPVGKNGKFLPISIASTGGVELMVEAFDSNAGTVNATNASNLSSTRWKATRVGALGNFTGYNVRIGDAQLTSSNIIVHSATENGVYDIVSTPTSAMTFNAGTPNTMNLTTAQTGGFLGNFSYSEGVACSGTPTPGATIASSVSVCLGQSITLSLASATTGSGVTYQWQSSINGGTTWTDISSATSSTLVITPTRNTSYQCIVTCSSNSGTSTPVLVSTSAPVVTGTDDTLCPGETANLVANGAAVINWYDAEINGNLVTTGTTYNPTVTSTTTYYVSSESVSTGSVNTLAYLGSSVSSALFKGIAFDVTNKLKLKTVTVYPKNTAALTPITITLYDANGNIVAGTSPVTFIPTLVTGTVGSTSQVVNLNYNIPPGTGYRLLATNGLIGTSNTLGNSTATITYPTAGPLRLTGNVSALSDAIVTTSNTTNCFHNLTFDEICESVRIPVTATVINVPNPIASATAQPTCSVATGTIEVTAPTGANLEYSIDGTNYQTSTTFTGVTSGTYNVTVKNTVAGCISSAASVTINVAPTTPPTPTGASNQVLNGGVASDVTIEDIVVSGTGIIWYPSALDATNNTNAILPGTVLTDNTTYYAVSTNGTCTSSALAVTVTVVLGNENFDLTQLNFYPNPVQNKLNITAKDVISKVEVFNIIGQKVKVINTNSNEIQIDLSDLNTETYLVKVYSEQNVQNFKVIKK